MPSRIAVHDYCGHPFQAQLSRELARRGHRVRHFYCSSFQTPHGDLDVHKGDPAGFDVAAVNVGREVKKYNPLTRLTQDITYGRRLVEAMRSFGPHVILSANTPLPSQFILQRYARASRMRFVYWLQDLYADAARRVLEQRAPVLAVLGTPVLRWLEQRMLRDSDAIVAITEDFIGSLDSRVAASKTTAIPNWAPLIEMPMRPKDNAWSRERELNDKFCFMYTGTLGFKHNPGLLLDLAQHTRDDPGVRTVVISEGVGADWLRTESARNGLTNLIVLKYQPYQMLPEVVATSDVLIAVLEREAGQFSVPSKVLTYLCAGRPLLLSVPAENLAARTVAHAGAGVVVPPDDGPRFVREALRLRGDEVARAAMGSAARRYAEATFDISRIADRFETVLLGDRGVRGREAAAVANH
jgi:colanic acid biosynthesis glycosyl transferase WcaI